ncbi:hypothetical protein ACT8ZS_19865 [Paenibacillus sp. M.A.Huq-84]
MSKSSTIKRLGNGRFKLFNRKELNPIYFVDSLNYYDQPYYLVSEIKLNLLKHMEETSLFSRKRM